MINYYAAHDYVQENSLSQLDLVYQRHSPFKIPRVTAP